MQRMNHGACAQEQQRLERGMGKEMEHASAIGADALGGEHVAELRAGRIGDHPLDVVLDQADGRGEEGGGGADDRDDAKRDGRKLEQGRKPRDHEHAGRDHGRGMDQGRDRGRAFHGVGEPGVEQKLRRLAHRSHE